MDNFKLASKKKLRYPTSRGPLSTEQLWDLSLQELDALAVSLEQQHKESGRKSFLVKHTTKDKEAKLAFDVVLEVLNTKAQEAIDAAETAEIREHNKKIISLIVEKKDEALRSMSVGELEKMLK